MAKIELFKRIIVKSKDGKIEYDSGMVPSNSYLVAFLQHIYGEFKGIYVDMIDTGNVSRSIPSPDYFLASRNQICAADDNATYGIVVGTDDTAETNTDYALVAQIAHGTGAGQLDYGAHSFTAPAVVSGNVDLVVSRSFYNGSGNTITVKEIGIYCYSYDGSVDRYLCIVRDVPTSPIAVDDTKTLTIQYTLRTTV